MPNVMSLETKQQQQRHASVTGFTSNTPQTHHQTVDHVQLRSGHSLKASTMKKLPGLGKHSRRECDDPTKAAG